MYIQYCKISSEQAIVSTSLEDLVKARAVRTLVYGGCGSITRDVVSLFIRMTHSPAYHVLLTEGSCTPKKTKNKKE